MALLTVFFLVIGNLSLWAATVLPAQNITIIFDAGNPDASVGVIDGELVEVGSWYENYEVIGFDKSSIIVKELVSADLIQWEQKGKIDFKTKKRARQFFIAKQMQLIYEAQVRYRDKMANSFAADLNTLINQEFLYDGFKAAEKQGYKFYISETGETGRMAPNYRREPTFFAVAEPLNPKKDPDYFSVDHLGLIRFAPSLNFLPSAPVWDYADRSTGPRTTAVVHSDE